MINGNISGLKDYVLENLEKIYEKFSITFY